jgi:hypothetical protein
MFRGFLGRLVRTYEPHTEADSTAIAVQALVAFGNAVGRGPCFYVGETRHGANENALIIGASSKARKGDGGHVALRSLRDADPEWSGRCTASGLSSAEGLIYAVRDPVERLNKKGEREVVDEGAADKRLLVMETEFSAVLRQFDRTGNTLSNTLRDAWDGKDVLRTLTKTSPVMATGAHVSVIGHCTPEDLHEHLTALHVANGLGNRFLLVLTERARVLPSPGRASPAATEMLARELADTLREAQEAGELCWTPAAEADWERIYPALSEPAPGLAGAMLARAEAHVVRLALLYALLDRAREIDVPHLESALAVWDVVRRSVQAVFAGRSGNDDADRIRDAIEPGGCMTLSEVHEHVFRRNISAGRVSTALELLQSLEEVRIEREETGGRPATVICRRPAEGWADAVDREGPANAAA